MASNLRKITSHLKLVRRAAAGVFRKPRPRRRETPPVQDWLPFPVGLRTSGRPGPRIGRATRFQRPFLQCHETQARCQRSAVGRSLAKSIKGAGGRYSAGISSECW